MHRFGASVVIPSYRGAPALSSTLESLAAQTLSPDRFEVVVVVNGPLAVDARPFEALRSRCAPLRLRLIRTTTPGASLAWNIGIQAARMEWLTFVDDDDTVTPAFLEALLDEARPGVVPLTEIHDRLADGSVDETTPLNVRIRTAAGSTVTAHQLPHGLGFNASKLIPTRWAKAARYDTRLTNGQDIAFFGTLSLMHDIRFAVPSASASAAYVRTVSDRSMSRQAVNYEFSIEHRLDVIEALDRARRTSLRRRRPPADHLVEAQAHLMRIYLDQHPAERSRVMATIAARDLRRFPYHVLNRGRATRLFVTDCPGLDRRRLARWARSAADPFDLLVIEPPGTRDASLGELAGDVAELGARLMRVRAAEDDDHERVADSAVATVAARPDARPYSALGAARRRRPRAVADALLAAGLGPPR